MHGRAKYRATGHGFVVRHEKFAENERMYSRSHFTKGLELMMLLIIYHLYGSTVSGSTAYILLTGSMWFLVISWLFASFIFNSSGFEWQKIVEDWDAFSKWISSHGGVVLVCQQPRAMNPTRISVCKDLEPPALNPSLFFQCFQSRAAFTPR